MKSLPSVTIIMPVRNEAAYIRRSLGSVLAQDYPPELIQIIIADGMSKDGTRSILDEYRARHPNLEVVDNPSRIVPTGMNAALRLAKGKIVIRVDGHCEIAPDYVRRCVQHLMEDGVDGVGGSIETIGESLLSQAIAAAMSSHFGVGGSAFRTRSGHTLDVDTIPFPAYTRKIINLAGAYDEELVRNQDDEYNYRIRALGGKLLLSGSLRSRYYSRGNLVSLWRQYFQYGYWKVRVFQKHTRQMQARQFVPFIFLGGLLLLLLISLIFHEMLYVGLSILLLYLVANLAASARTAARCGWRFLPVLPLIFATLHVSYGLGFITGLVKFSNRWGDRFKKIPSGAPHGHAAHDHAAPDHIES
jgi:glycosyltransferase involved in cell wall biosynthesis